MEDREMLELAAKAAGWGRLEWHEQGYHQAWMPNDEGYSVWNPLRNDGDALRLAVKLGLSIDFIGSDVRVQHFGADGIRRECLEDYIFGQDRFAATRRAIVRTAAGIDASMMRAD